MIFDAHTKLNLSIRLHTTSSESLPSNERFRESEWKTLSAHTLVNPEDTHELTFAYAPFTRYPRYNILFSGYFYDNDEYSVL